MTHLCNGHLDLPLCGCRDHDAKVRAASSRSSLERAAKAASTCPECLRWAENPSQPGRMERERRARREHVKKYKYMPQVHATLYDLLPPTE